jgi:hypothetical protein
MTKPVAEKPGAPWLAQLCQMHRERFVPWIPPVRLRDYERIGFWPTLFRARRPHRATPLRPPAKNTPRYRRGIGPSLSESSSASPRKTQPAVKDHARHQTAACLDRVGIARGESEHTRRFRMVRMWNTQVFSRTSASQCRSPFICLAESVKQIRISTGRGSAMLF